MIMDVRNRKVLENFTKQQRAKKYQVRTEVSVLLTFIMLAALILVDLFFYQQIFFDSASNPHFPSVLKLFIFSGAMFIIPLILTPYFWEKFLKVENEWDEIDKVMTNLGYRLNEDLDIYEKEGKQYSVEIVEEKAERFLLEVKEINLIIIKRE